jgi:hypothetical protein
VDVNLSFGGVELGGLVSWAQKIAMSDRVVSISVQYAGPKTTLSMTPNRTAGDSIWLAVVWCLALIAIFAPLAVAKYRRTASR